MSVSLARTMGGSAASAPFSFGRSATRLVLAGLIAGGGVLIGLPLVMAGYMSLFSDGVLAFPPSGYTLGWYARLSEFPQFGASLSLSLRIAAAATLASLVLGVPASLAIVRYRFPGRAVLNVLLLSPLTVPAIVLGLALYVLVVQAEIATGAPLVGSDTVLVLSHALITLPWVIRLCVANLVDLDRGVEEAAANLGARPRTVLWRVTLPMMRQGIVAAALFAFIISFENIELTLFLISPGSVTLPVAVLQYLEYRVDPLVAAIAVVQTVVIGIMLLTLDRFVRLSRIV